MEPKYKFRTISIPIVVLLITTAQLPEHAEADIKSVFETVKYWVWGPPGTVTVLGTNQSSSIFSIGGSTARVDMDPQWSMTSFSFPLAGMEGVLVKANPPDACFNLEDPPKQLTSAEMALEEADGNNSSTGAGGSTNNNWFLIAEDGVCDYDTKIRNADWAGYTVLIIRQTSVGAQDKNISTVIDAKTNSMNIYTCTVTEDDGLTLDDYSYPTPYLAEIKDLRKSRVLHASLKITGLSLGGVAAVAVASGAVYAIVKQVNKKKEVVAAVADKEEELKVKVAKNLPSEKWKPDPTNMRLRCKWCHKTFDHDDEVTTLLCGHQFHKRCLAPRILDGHAYCPICRAEIHSAPTPDRVSVIDESTERTPLLQSVHEEVEEEAFREGRIETFSDGRKPRYHCYICEILGLPLKDELEIVEELAQVAQSPQQHSPNIPNILHQQLQARASRSLLNTPSALVRDVEDDIEVDIEVEGDEGESSMDNEVARLTAQMLEIEKNSVADEANILK